MTKSRPKQHWDPERYARAAGFVPELGEPLLEHLAPQPGERILDLGCGDGVLSLKIAELGAEVLGVDASAEQIAVAQDRGLDARVADAHALDFENEFHGVFSNAALHWMTEPEAVIAGVWRALMPGGRFVGEMGGAGNVDGVVAALLAALDRRGIDGAAAHPWYFPGPDEYQALLQAAGFRLRLIELFDRPTPLPGAMSDWLETFTESFLGQVAEADRPALMAELSDTLRPTHCDAEGRWSVDYVRLRFAADKPA